jgi:hypothetical protein
VVFVVVEKRGGAAVWQGPLLVVVLVVVNQGLLEVVELDVQLLHQIVDRDDAAVGEVAEPPHIGEDNQAGKSGLGGLGSLELLRNFLIVGACGHQVHLDVGELCLELADDGLFHVLGLARVVGPEIERGGRLDVGEVDGSRFDGGPRTRGGWPAAGS